MGGLSRNQGQEFFTSFLPPSIFSSNTNTLMNSRTSWPCSSSVGGSSSNPMAIGSAYTSATALLQKAAEMGAKISDNTIAPMLLRGFTGCSTSSMNSSGHVQESSLGVGNNVGPISANNGGLYAGDQQMFGTNIDQRAYNISQTGLFQSPMFVHSENGNSANITGGEFMEGGGKLTVDFLGIEPAAHSNIGKKRSYHDSVMELDGSNGQQTLHNLHSEW
ncbi:uncharacterized protein LOC120001110 [Tripterygium wilfordii]|nr:uncharacterized protein LOC120001110 [Tripterygium wilfordii]